MLALHSKKDLSWFICIATVVKVFKPFSYFN